MRRRATALLVAALLAPVLAACSQVPGADESYREDIPAAIEQADIGVTGVWADSSLSGFTETLSVGGTVTGLGEEGGSLLDDSPDAEIDDALVQRVIALAVGARSLPMAYFRLSLEDAAGDDIDVVPALERLGAAPLTNGRITMDEAEQIAEGADG